MSEQGMPLIEQIRWRSLWSKCYLEPLKPMRDTSHITATKVAAGARLGGALGVALGLALATAELRAGEEIFEQAPIAYSATAPQDAIARLEAKLAVGAVKLAGDDREILRQLLQALDVPEASQMVVFSKTSFQLGLIHPGNPRALYFSDTCYVGWVPGGLMEVASIDPQLGPVFYHFDPQAKAAKKPRFSREPDCLRCHGGTFVRDIPAVFTRSIATERSGQPIYSQGSTVVDDATPFAERWGGWFVTGTGGAKHRGNVLGREDDGRLVTDLDYGGSRAELPLAAGPQRFPVPTSDVAALLVFEHQCTMQNALTRAAFQCRRILHYQQNLQRDLKETVTEQPTYDSAKRVFDASAQDVLDILLFKDEAVLPAGAIGRRGAFPDVYEQRGRRTRDGHSLRELDLKAHVFRLRCSPLIDSASFQALPLPLKQRLAARLRRVLESPETEPRYAYLTAGERAGIRTVLVETLPAVLLD